MNWSAKRIVARASAAFSLVLLSSCSTTSTVSSSSASTVSPSSGVAASIATTPASRIKTFPSFSPDPLDIVGGGTLSSTLKDFRLTIVETTIPNSRSTKYSLKWAYHNHTQDDKNWSPLQISISLLDSNGVLIGSVGALGFSPRDKCSYNPIWNELEGSSTGPDLFDYIASVKLHVNYSASYQGAC